jgi:hypothetical protein
VILRIGVCETKENEVAAGDIVPVPGTQFEETLASASPDLLREMIKGFAQRMMDAEVEQVCGAGYGEVTPERVNSRNGYRRRDWDTRAGTIELAIPKVRQGTYYPEWLLERRYPGAQVRAAMGIYPGQDHLRAARRRVRPRPAPPGGHCPGGKVPGRG